MAKFSNKTLTAIKDLLDGLDGVGRVTIKSASEHTPKGVEQECYSEHVKVEWVDQTAGYCGDDYYGTVTWRLGDFYLIAEYAC